MGIRLVDPQIANRTRARKNRTLSNQSFTVPNLEGRTGSSRATPTSRHSGYDVDAGERDAPSFPSAYNPTRDASSQIGMLEGITGQYGPALNRASRDIAALVANNKAKNALGDHMRQNAWAYGYHNPMDSVPGLNASIDFGVAQQTPYGLGQGGATMGGLESFAFDNPVLSSSSSSSSEEEETGGGVTPYGDLSGFDWDREFGSLEALQNALWAYRSGLNANELQRSRAREDYAKGIDSYRRKADRAARQIPDIFNQRGMINSGLYDRGQGEFEAQRIYDEGDFRHKFNRVLQDLGFSDRGLGYQFDDKIREDATQAALASAAQAAQVNLPENYAMTGGSGPLNAAALEAMMSVVGKQFQPRG